MKKDLIVVTGGAGFVGSNLIKKLLTQTNFKILSIDDYSSGEKKNNIKDKRVKYINGSTININYLLKSYKKKIHTIFHFGEFSRIYQSFKKYSQCFDSNVRGTEATFLFCLKNKIKLIYSATSASLGNKGKDKDLSPYSFTKSKNLELLENLKNWFNFKYEVIYFYNVYGPNQICEGDMATVIGIFEKSKLDNKNITVVKPGTQSRKFTHIDDTIEVCMEAWSVKKCLHYSISNKKTYSILDVAKMFKQPIKYLSKRDGERFSSSVVSIHLSNKVHKRFGKIDLKDYVSNFLKNIS
ncbi:NAD-dependent epimerase/dehydratase family protein [Candidatus Pelagibacter sp. Uisw_090]|uniref:NAD-dependent epimerase/dehydratase family protein n=1 Tax=Candidatus Pelagibacter sp. Uisw_090 TaxID=3230993 RepID=UPI0039E8EC55